MKSDLLNLDGKVIGQVDLSDEIFNSKISSGSLYFKFNAEIANIHPGTVMKKNRALVSGSGRKLYRQKGTGRARVGSIRSPIRRGGGRAFGGQRKNYKIDIPEKIGRKALISLITAKFKNNAIKFIEDIKIETHKTNELVKKLENLINLKNEKGVLIVNDENVNLKKAASNLKTLKLLNVKRLAILPLIGSNKIFITKSALEYLNNLSKL